MDSTKNALHNKDAKLMITPPNETVDSSSARFKRENRQSKQNNAKEEGTAVVKYLKVDLHHLKLDDSHSSPFEFKLPQGRNNEGDVGRVVCHVCQKDLTRMNVQRQQQHLNRCMDKAEKLNKAASASAVLNCPVCGKTLTSEKQRRVHLKICGKSSRLTPQEVLDKIKQQEAGIQQNDGNVPSLQTKPQADERPKQKRGRKRATTTKTKQSWETDEELQVAMAISASLTDGESKNVVSDLYDRKTKKKKKCGKSSKTESLKMPVLLSRSDAERNKITIDRFSNILEWNSDDEEDERSLPTSRLKTVMNMKRSSPSKPHVSYWSLASLTGNNEEELFYKQSQKRVTENDRSLSILTQTTRSIRPTSEQNESLPNTCKILAELAEDHVTQSPQQQIFTAEPWHRNQLIECFSSLIDNEFLSDVKIHCENETSVHAHSFIIQLRCPDLHKTFSRDDSTWSCDLTSYSRSSVLAFLSYMYAANIDMSVFLLPEIINLLKRYHMDGLDHLCQQLQADRQENENDVQFISKDLDELMEGIEEEEEEEEELEKMNCSDDEDDDRDVATKSPPRDNFASASFYEKPICTPEKGIGIPDELIRTPYEPIRTPDEPIRTLDEPIGTPDKPSRTSYKPSRTSDKPIRTPDILIRTSDKPIRTSDKPIRTSDKPIRTSDKPIRTSDKPIRTSDKPIRTPDKPSRTSDKPSRTSDKPSRTSDKPSRTPDKPIRTPDKPSRTPDKPIRRPDKLIRRQDKLIRRPDKLIRTLDKPNRTSDKPSRTPDKHDKYIEGPVEIPKPIAIDEKHGSKAPPQVCDFTSSNRENNDEKETFDASTPVVMNFQRRHFQAPTTSPIFEQNSDRFTFKRRITNSVHADRNKQLDPTCLQVTNHESNLNVSLKCVDLSIKDDDDDINKDDNINMMVNNDGEQDFMFAYDENAGIWNESGFVAPTSQSTDHDSNVNLKASCIDLTDDDDNKDNDNKDGDQCADSDNLKSLPKMVDLTDDDDNNENDEVVGQCADNEQELMFAFDEDVGIWNDSGDMCDLTGKQPDELTETPEKKNVELPEMKESDDYSQKKDRIQKNLEKKNSTLSSIKNKNMDSINASVCVASPTTKLRTDALEFSCTESFLLELQSGKLKDDQLWGGCVSLTDCHSQQLSKPNDVLPNKAKKKKKATKGKEPEVSIPAVDALNTPALKKELSQFGVKALSKKQSKILLKEIYRQSESEKGKLAEDKEEVAKPTTSHDISESDKSSSEHSESETTDDEDDHLLQDENFVCSPTKHGQDVDALLSGFIKQNPALHTRVLLYEAIDFTKLHQDIVASGIKFSKTHLIQFLDKKCINFRYTEAGSQQKKRRGKNKIKRKPKSSTENKKC